MNVDTTCKTLFFCEKHFSWMLLLHEAMFHILILLFPITIVTNASLSQYERKYDREVILKFLNLFLILTIHNFISSHHHSYFLISFLQNGGNKKLVHHHVSSKSSHTQLKTTLISTYFLLKIIIHLKSPWYNVRENTFSPTFCVSWWDSCVYLGQVQIICDTSWYEAL